MNQLLELNNIYKSFKENLIFENANAFFEAGTVTAIVGINGSGKSVLMKLISGLMGLQNGEIRYNNKVINKESLHQINIGLSIEKPSFIEELSMLDNLKFLASFRNLISTKEIKSWTTLLDIQEFENKKMRTLSMGTRQKVAIIQAFMESPNIILLDEVSGSLDEKSKKILYELIKKEKSNGKIIIYICHDSSEIEKICDRKYKIIERKLILC